MNKIITLFVAVAFATMVSAQTTLPTSWDFTTPGISTPPNGWTLNLGTNGNLTYASGIGDILSCRLDAAGENVVIWFADKPGAVSYYLKGTGISPAPVFSGTFTIQEGPDTSHWSDMQAVTTMTGSFVRYVNTPLATSRYIRFYYTTKVSGSNVALDSILILSAPASPNAAINVKQGTTSLVNGNTFSIGKSASTLFTIENKGTSQALTLSNKSITGLNASDYTIGYFPSSIAANSSDTFRIVFNPASNGSRKASLTFNTNDSLKNTFGIDLYGIGGNYASEPTQQATNISFTNLKAYTLNVSFKNPSSTPEKYIVLRKKSAAITEVPVDGQIYVRGDYIGGAQVVYIGTDTSFTPTNIIANTTYYFSVFSCNGPSGFENYLTTSPLNGNITTGGKNIGTYYAGISSSASTFITDLHNKINVHDTIYYSNYAPTIVNNFIARDTTGSKKVVNCVYTTLPYIYDDPFKWWSSNALPPTLTREHTYCQSWMPSNVGNPNWPNGSNGKELPEYNDIHHLFPADQANANGKRSNYPFGEVVTPTFVSPTGMGKLGLDSAGHTVWEPRDAHKGDLARALFYMSVAYNGVNGKNWSIPAQQNQEVLKKWHFQDPPDAWEIARHEYVNSIQRNRNPFIDSIYWVNKIDFSNMSIISAVTPGITLTSPIGGENWKSNNAYNITWASANVDSVKIDLMVNDTFYAVVSPSTLSSAGSFNWLISPITLATTKAKIRITDKKTTTNAISANYFNITSTTGIDALSMAKNISIYPNPSQGNITINFDMHLKGNVEIFVFDITGRLVKSLESSDNATKLSIENKGVYIVQLKINGTAVYKKIVVE